MRRLTLPLLTAVLVLCCAAPAQAITFGTIDTGDLFASTGAAIYDDPVTGPKQVLCSGTLISPTVFLTAAHCTDYLTEIGEDDVWVTFDPSFDADSPLLHGTYHTHPLYASGGMSDTYDLAVIVLDEPVLGIAPAQLPAAGLLDELSLRDQRFTAVGYGAVREDKRKGPQTAFRDSIRRYADQGFRSLTGAWLNLSGNVSSGSGGTCNGDSGGPHFLVGTDVVVSVTVMGDRFCRATDVGYRLDTENARDFLGRYVTLP